MLVVSKLVSVEMSYSVPTHKITNTFNTSKSPNRIRCFEMGMYKYLLEYQCRTKFVCNSTFHIQQACEGEKTRFFVWLVFTFTPKDVPVHKKFRPNVRRISC